MATEDVPLSVLLVSEPGTNGVFQYVRSLARHLIGAGIGTHFAYSTARGGAPDVEALAGEVRAAGGKSLDLRVGNYPQPADVRALFQLRRLARAVRANVIHAHSSKAGALARALPQLGSRARLFYTPHAYYEMHGSAVDARKRVFITVERLLARVGITVNVSASEEQYAREVIRVPPALQRTVYTGVDCERFRPAPNGNEKTAARRRFGLPENALIVGTVARYTPQKDPRTLYLALRRCLEQNPALVFAHLGRGELSPEIDALVASAPPDVRSRIYRLESSDDSPRFYQALDAFVLPSRFEGFALSVLEALASGLPLILSDVPGNSDVRLFPFDHIRWTIAGDVKTLAAEVNAWAGRPPESTNHRAVILREFSAAGAFARMVELYRGNGVASANGGRKFEGAQEAE